MSLRVLLADESATIKRVMQLALQDYAVEVRSVSNGLDVLAACDNFHPDIVFADVLLAKKNGYDVCAELKRSPNFSRVPFVLMWSGFISLDEKKLASSKPDARLEKPFDADILRKITSDLVPRLQSNVISQYLSFPDLPAIEESAPPPSPEVAEEEAPPPPARLGGSPNQRTPPPPSMKPAATFAKAQPPPPSKKAKPKAEVEEGQYDPGDLFEEPDDFKHAPLPPPKTVAAKPAPPEDPEDWSEQDLADFKLPADEEDLARAYEASGIDIDSSAIAIGEDLEEILLEDVDPGFAKKPPAKKAPPPTPPSKEMPRQKPIEEPLKAAPQPTVSMDGKLSHERMEQIMREEIRAVLEDVAWKVLPDLAERIVREELQKLLKDAERL